MASRRLRAFKRWMSSNNIQYSNALHFTDDELAGISVFSTRDLSEGDLIATIPKISCLTIKNSGASEMIEAVGLEGSFGLSVAIMYERSLGSDSPWSGYLQLLPFQEELPLVWSLDELDRFLCGTELHKTLKEDKALVHEDWKDYILPLIHSEEFALNPKFFRVEDYFAAKSLVASRSFQIDDYHGEGMVPLADLFNHKTGAEDVHFTSVESDDSDDEGLSDDDNSNGDELTTQTFLTEEDESMTNGIDHSSSVGPESQPQDVTDNPLVLEMVLVKDVKADAEVFNTYGSVGNAALLHRYGFTELDNPYDIVNIDMELVVKWSLTLVTSRQSRARISLWRKLSYSGCISQNSEYFEISPDGEPQLELLILLYLILLPEEAYTKLDLKLATSRELANSSAPDLSHKNQLMCSDLSELSTQMLLTKDVCKALLSLADMRESLYGAGSLETDVENLRRCECIKERKLYHSLVLRISERRIIQKLRCYTQKGMKSLGKSPPSKKLKS
ncbi:ribosomal lysine N-methyltransferase 3 [Silene latifolia]|uniref:ribosomal lysine N-methyltransferase 3 n=1 Tax=Silene latifolia TaxID=37657 RepID=UPI003D77D187